MDKKFFILALILTILLNLIPFKSVLADFPAVLKIIILADMSGSMKYSLDGSSWSAPIGQRRIDYIVPGLEALATFLQILKDDPAAGGFGVSVYYAIGQFPGISPEKFTLLKAGSETSSDIRRYDSSYMNEILSNLGLPYDQTPIGTAINEAIDRFPVPGSDEDQVIFLFTDGKSHGVDTPIFDPPAYDCNNVVFRDKVDQECNPDPNGKIKIAALGFGDYAETDAETDFEMLKKISKIFRSYNPNTSSSDIFTKRAVEAMSSTFGWDSDFTMSDPSFQIQSGVIQEHPYCVTPYDSTLIFMVSWSEPKLNKTIRFTIRSTSEDIDPDFAATSDDINYYSGRTYQIYAIKKSYLQTNIGEWKLIINGESIEKSEWYAYSILGNSGLRLKNILDHHDGPFYAGDKIKIKVSLAAGENPITDAIVTAKIIGPEKGAGNWFAEYPLIHSQLDTVKNLLYRSGVKDFTTEDVYKKFDYMFHFKGVPMPGEVTFDLPLKFNDQDGFYYGETPFLNHPGIYEVQIAAKNNPNDNNILFNRDIVADYYLEFKPDLNWIYSSLKFKKIGEDYVQCKGFKGFLNDILDIIPLMNRVHFKCKLNIFEAKFTPRDTLLNYLKPGKEKNIKFIVNKAKLSEKPIMDDLEGSYYKEIIVDESEVKPTLQIQYNNHIFREKVITDDPRAYNWSVNPTALSLHVGITNPQDTTAKSYDQGLYAAIDITHQLTKNWAGHLLFGYNRFRGIGNTSNKIYWNISPNLRWFPIVQSYLRWYINAGGGLYFSGNNKMRYGYNYGTGIDIPLNSRLDFEIGVDANKIIMSGNDFKFDRLNLGFQIRF